MILLSRVTVKAIFSFNYDFILLDFNFEPFMSYVRSRNLSIPSAPVNRIERPVNDFIALPP